MSTSKQNIYEFMHSLPIEGDTSQVDAMTITATGLEGKLSISLVIETLSKYLALEEKKPFTFRKAKGWQRGSVSYAEETNELGKLWAILMVRGEQSTSAFQTALLLDDVKYTRVDVATDVMLLEQVTQLPRKLKDTYKGKFKVTLIESLTGDTLYVGSRESGVYIRIYDKSNEYGKDLGYVWRFEVEFKSSKAPVIAEHLKRSGIEIASDIVWTACRSRDIPTPLIGRTVDIRGRKISVSSIDQKLAWLGGQVKPTVKFLMSIGRGGDVYEKLGLPEIGTIAD